MTQIGSLIMKTALVPRTATQKLLRCVLPRPWQMTGPNSRVRCAIYICATLGGAGRGNAASYQSGDGAYEHALDPADPAEAG